MHKKKNFLIAKNRKFSICFIQLVLTVRLPFIFSTS